MNFIVFTIIGLIGGWIVTEVNSEMRHHVFRNAAIGVLGALVGGYIFVMLGVSEYNFWEEMGTSMAGTTVILFIMKLICTLPERKYSVRPVRSSR